MNAYSFTRFILTHQSIFLSWYHKVALS